MHYCKQSERSFCSCATQGVHPLLPNSIQATARFPAPCQLTELDGRVCHLQRHLGRLPRHCQPQVGGGGQHMNRLDAALLD